jgi:hypothetical protein
MDENQGHEKRIYYDPRFYGTENYQLYAPLGKYAPSILLSDSVVQFAKEKQAFWALEVIYLYFPIIQIAMRDADTNIIFIHFDVDSPKCEFYVQLDSGLPRLFEQNINFTDLDVFVELYLQNGVLMFPSDY